VDWPAFAVGEEGVRSAFTDRDVRAWKHWDGHTYRLPFRAHAVHLDARRPYTLVLTNLEDTGRGRKKGMRPGASVYMCDPTGRSIESMWEEDEVTYDSAPGGVAYDRYTTVVRSRRTGLHAVLAHAGVIVDEGRMEGNLPGRYHLQVLQGRVNPRRR